MRGNRKGNIKKERIIMITSSALVLAALTMTGLYLKDRTAKVEDDGYSIDFSALENTPGDKYSQIVENTPSTPLESLDPNQLGIPSASHTVPEDDLDYAPPTREVDSGHVEIGNTTPSASTEEQDLPTNTQIAKNEPKTKPSEEERPQAQPETTPTIEDTPEEPQPSLEANSGIIEVAKTLHFPETLLKPSPGNVLIPFSMDGSVYFATLDQYKYNPAMIVSALEGDPVAACAEGKVISSYTNEEIGNAIVLDLGDGYEATYGQLRDVQYAVGDYVNAGATLGFVAAPTKYYSVEGANIFFQLKKEQAAVDPTEYFAP
ncbi:MAG: peptidoglycan DD-metalloendopeptidase family protein [Lachnospiraceae bacterium]|jgi:hypothetical protein|nr:peptidoglycan DD-metalloendopeptidase family protein [Lachnospiraceae bacterium]